MCIDFGFQFCFCSLINDLQGWINTNVNKEKLPLQLAGVIASSNSYSSYCLNAHLAWLRASLKLVNLAGIVAYFPKFYAPKKYRVYLKFIILIAISIRYCILLFMFPPLKLFVMYKV